MKSTTGMWTLLLLLGALSMPIVKAADEPENNVEIISVRAADELAATHSDALILDVRTPAEYRMSHIPGAVNVDVQDAAFAAAVARLDPARTYIVHCTKNPEGGRSSRALDTMRELGFRNLYSLERGFLGWKEADLPLVEASE